MRVEVVEGLVLAPETVLADDASGAGWAKELRGLVTRAAAEGRTVRVSVEEQSFTPHEAAGLLGVSRTTVQRWIKCGIIKPITRGTRHHITASEIRRCRQARPGRVLRG
ncbi:MAG: helix-turn-helix domain-containing protein [Bifidobacteriaceae bacterium]|jgi:excisionase family DNA binding protein|nr:helix-turn-helix domain-containing protein [Bifidobacteriaceae bacterium]